jgi:hypothetical protein
MSRIALCVLMFLMWWKNTQLCELASKRLEYHTSRYSFDSFALFCGSKTGQEIANPVFLAMHPSLAP